MRKRKSEKTNPVKVWMQAATVTQQEMLAKFARTTRSYLYQLSCEGRRPSAELAIRLEAGSELVAKLSRKKNQAAPDPMARQALCPNIFGPLNS